MTDVPDRPNLVFILPDRQRRDTMACYGNDWIHVPHLNGLASEGGGWPGPASCGHGDQ